MRPPMAKKMVMMMVVFTLMGATAAQTHCDPLTQYELGGRCCKMCSKGTRMINQDTCEEPKCEECGENEYQDEFTHSDRCKRQPYCDPNKNFQMSVPNKEKKIMLLPCLCLDGFHCSSPQCLTCVPHTSCKPGHGVVYTGNQTHDTVCQECPEGTFSQNDSQKEHCEKHQECQNGYQVKESGTDRSDNICEKTRDHWPIVIGVAVFVVIVGVVLYTLCFCRGNAKGVKGCVESCRGESWEIHRDPVPMTPEDDDGGKDVGPVRLLPTQVEEEGSSVRTPVEDLDELSAAEYSLDPSRTENGNYVGQEMGKAETLSRQESQTEPITRQLSSTHTYTG